MKYFAVILLLAASAFAGTGHIYNLESGEVITIKYKGSSHGTLKGKLSSGEALSGEFSVTRSGMTSWGSIYGSLYSGNRFASGNAQSVGLSVNNQGQGVAIVTGDRGTFLECEFVSSGHGSGACKDKNGGKYRLIF